MTVSVRRWPRSSLTRRMAKVIEPKVTNNGAEEASLSATCVSAHSTKKSFAN